MNRSPLKAPREGGSIVRLLGRLLVYGVLGLWSVVCLMPIYWTLIASIKAPVEFIGDPHYLPFFDFEPSLHAWRRILLNSDDHTLERFINSFVVALSSTGLTVLVGLSAAYALVRLKVTLPFGAAGALVAITLVPALPCGTE